MSAPPASPRIIVIGASTGAVPAILELAAALPPNFPAPVLFVHHVGSHRSELYKLVTTHGPNPACHPRDGEVPECGRIYIAPPDHHMLLEQGRISLSRDPKEHHSRPAIDPLFRSVAIEYGPRAIGVVLTGMLDDGSSGLRAIKDREGIAVVQDPNDARAPSMPLSALACVDVDHVIPLSQMGALLHRLALLPVRPMPAGVPTALVLEHEVVTGEKAMENLKAIGSPSTFTCPDCGGVLFELDNEPVRYRCHTGHAFSLRSLAHVQEELTDSALWAALRALQEKEAVLRRLAAASLGRHASRASAALHEADEIATAAKHLRELVEKAPAGIESFDILS